VQDKTRRRARPATARLIAAHFEHQIFFFQPFGPIVPVSVASVARVDYDLADFQAESANQRTVAARRGPRSRISRSDVPLARPERASRAVLDVARRCLASPASGAPESKVSDWLSRSLSISLFEATPFRDVTNSFLLPEHLLCGFAAGTSASSSSSSRRPPFSPPRSERPRVSRWSLSPRNSTLLRLLV